MLFLLASSAFAAHVIPSASVPELTIAQGKGHVRILVEAPAKAAMTLLTLEPGAAVPEHVHEESDELLYLEAGAVEMTIAGKPVTAKAGDAVHIPAGTPHSARVHGSRTLKAVQIYAGPGPEQRFKAPRP
jgi:quercetin dioxygenase-like cupin family protein